MALKTDIRGMVWKYPDTFVVGREQVRQYAKAVKSADAGQLSTRPRPPNSVTTRSLRRSTFASIFAVMIQNHFFQHVDVGLETMQIVQVDQKFHFHRPIKVGDELTGTMYVESVDERFGADIVTTRNVCADENGDDRDGGVHDADGPRGRQLDLGEVGSRDGSGHPHGRRRKQPERRERGLVPSAGGALHSALGVFPVQRAVRRFQIDRTGSARFV